VSAPAVLVSLYFNWKWGGEVDQHIPKRTLSFNK